ncbi:hypothetical protein JCM17823_00810 [Halorubrum gandharaense]
MSQATLGSGPYRNSNLFSGYFLDERVADLDAWDCDDEAEAAFEQIRELWEQEGSLLSSYKEDELLDTWIAEILDVLGYGTSSEVTLPDGGGYVDRLLFESDDVRRESAKQALDSGTAGHFSRAAAILEAKQWDADFEKFFSEQRSYRDASHQIKYYLERTPGDLKWGVLTDGKKWRLYGTKDYETQTYYEVDLPEILESGNLEAFKYFYVFFRPEAFVERAGSSFLDDVWTESETAAQELGEDLQDNVFRALRVLGKGFVESNDLDIDPDDEAARDELKEQSLVLLYRLMFVLYAESRGLIDPDDPAASEEYQEYFSLEAKREEIVDDVDGLDVESGAAFDDEYSSYSSSIWGRLTELFELIDEGEEDLDIPPYNGGLFSREDHAFLDEHEVTDPYIAEVVFWLSTTENDEGDHVPADYADLDTRHLGSIYEGLLEHEFRIAGEEGVAAVSADGGQVWEPAGEVSVADAVEVVDEGGLYVVNDEGERKATGAYYTPDYVVTYIVEETVDPLIDEIDADLREQGLEPSDREYFVEFWQEVKDLTVLDPAMGSGHFLTKATGYLTEQVMAVVREQEEVGSYDEQYLRREISKECIYGVDLNGMAVELAKLSMWLETLAADQPLAFLDHHLKAGNSLVGSDITEVLSEDGGDDDTGQITLTQAFARVRQDTLEHVMELMADLLAFDNETLEDVKSMEELYDEIREDPLYQRLFELANVHTAAEFGVDVPEGAYEQMAGAIEDEADWEAIAGEDWFEAAQATAAEQAFFHWELEFPEVFFGRDGEKLAGAGFDAVVGNPPYIRIQNIANDTLVDYLGIVYQSTHQNYDLAVPFTEKGYQLLSERGIFGYIETKKWIQGEYGEMLREYLTEREAVTELVDFGDQQIFDGASTYTVLLFLEKSHSPEFRYLNVSDLEGTVSQLKDAGGEGQMRTEGMYAYDENIENLGGDPWVFALPGEREILDKIEPYPELGSITDEIFQGIITGADPIYILEVRDEKNDTVSLFSKEQEDVVELEKEILNPLLRGKDMSKWTMSNCDQRVIFPYNTNPSEGHYSLISENVMRESYPKTWEYLSQNRQRLIDRSGVNEEDWWQYGRPQNLDKFETDKLMTQVLAAESSFALDEDGEYVFVGGGNAGGYGVVLSPETNLEHKSLLPILNSNLLEWVLQKESSQFRGGYYSYARRFIEKLPVCVKELQQKTDESSESMRDVLESHTEDMLENVDQRRRLNTDLLDYINSTVDPKSITDLGLFQPASQSSQKLEKCAGDYPSLRIGTAAVERESPNTVLIKATARYKPDDEDASETDQWGYTETEFLPAFRITDLTETEADLIEHFVPVAVDEASGFANFRETATKTNSLVDRLKAIELPDPDDVADDLENYLRTVERAGELDEKIAKTDDLIDEIVYELYGLSEEEIEIVEEAVN